MPDARFPLAGSPPGALSQRADLSPAAAFQPQRIPTGMPYGKAKQVEQMMSARPLRDADAPTGPSPGPPVRPGAGVGPAPGPTQLSSPIARPGKVPSTLGAKDPAEIMKAIGHMSNYPQDPLGVPSPARAATFRLSVLQQLATLPYASDAIRALVPQAEAEVNAYNP